MTKRMAMIAAALAGSLGAASPSEAATEIFLKVTDPATGLAGEATMSGYHGDIQLLSYSQSVQSPALIGANTGGAGAGKPSCGQITLTKRIDRSSPGFIKAVMLGEAIRSATIYFVDTQTAGGGGRPQNDYTVTLTDALVTSVAQSDASPAELVESVSLVAARFSVHYVPFGPGAGGGPGAPGTAIDFTVDCSGLR